MSMGVRLDIRQSQQLVMTPQLQQAIKLLQMSNLDLAEYVAQEVERNPLLQTTTQTPEERREERSDDRAAEGGPKEREDLTSQISADRAANAEETFDTGLENVYADEARADTQSAAPAPGGESDAGSWSTVGKGGSSKFDNPDYDLEATLASEVTLREHLLKQLGLVAASTAVRAIAANLVEQIDDSGYLRVDATAVAERLGASELDVEAAIRIIQGFDPVGVGARSLSECIKLQVAERNRLDPAMEALIDNLELLARAETGKLLKICGIGAEDLREMIAEIRALDPKPGARFHSEIAQTLIPDVYVRQNEMGGWNLELNADTLPKVLVDTRYSSEVTKGGAEVKAYISECMQNANWLVKSLDQRARTIIKVSSEIVKQQDGFFAYGVHELRPLNLKAVADAIEMHESTVSRVTSNKYIATNRGVFELKFFFTAAIGSTDGGEAYSAESIRHRIKGLIEDEDPRKILSDDKIVQILRGTGVDIARRTVAKYRETLNIPSSVQRRRQKSAMV